MALVWPIRRARVRLCYDSRALNTPPRKPRENRERIMAAIREAAIAEFSENGLKGTSTQAIAARAGLTKPQLHYYIKGKEELYEELLLSVMDDWKGMFDAGSTDPGQVLGAYIRLKIDQAFDKPEVSRIFTREVLDLSLIHI